MAKQNKCVNCCRYPIVRYIIVTDKHGKDKVKTIYLYKYPVNSLPPSLDD
jgi:hypothetical protein